jgi:hypothetical protein
MGWARTGCSVCTLCILVLASVNGCGQDGQDEATATTQTEFTFAAYVSLPGPLNTTVVTDVANKKLTSRVTLPYADAKTYTSTLHVTDTSGNNVLSFVWGPPDCFDQMSRFPNGPPAQLVAEKNFFVVSFDKQESRLMHVECLFANGLTTDLFLSYGD